MIDTSIEDIKSDCFGLSQIREFLEANERLDLIKQVDPDGLCSKGMGMVFNIDGHYYACDQEIYRKVVGLDAGKDMLELQFKLLLIERKARILKEMDAKPNKTDAEKASIMTQYTDAEKEHLKELAIEIQAHEDRAKELAGDNNDQTPEQVDNN